MQGLFHAHPFEDLTSHVLLKPSANSVVHADLYMWLLGQSCGLQRRGEIDSRRCGNKSRGMEESSTTGCWAVTVVAAGRCSDRMLQGTDEESARGRGYLGEITKQLAWVWERTRGVFFMCVLYRCICYCFVTQRQARCDDYSMGAVWEGTERRVMNKIPCRSIAGGLWMA